jgi:glutamate synthase (NADPH/NADH) large chain
VDLEPLTLEDDVTFLKALIQRHEDHTRSGYAASQQAPWDEIQPRFVKVMPRDYKRVLATQARAQQEGREPSFAELVGAATSG